MELASSFLADQNCEKLHSTSNFRATKSIGLELDSSFLADQNCEKLHSTSNFRATKSIGLELDSSFLADQNCEKLHDSLNFRATQSIGLKLSLVGNYCRALKHDFSATLLRKIRNDMRIEYKNYVGAINSVNLLYEDNDYVYIPRVYALHTIHCTELRGRLVEGRSIKCENAKYNLLDWQQATCEKFIRRHFNDDAIAMQRAGGIISLPTGVGKTFILMELMRKFKRKTVWFTITDPVVRQTIEILRKSFSDLIIASTKDKNWREADVLVSTCHKFVLHRFVEKEWVKTIGTVIYDEIHSLGGPVFRKIFDRFPVKYQIGASATPERDADSMDIAYKYLVGDIFIDPTISPPRFPGHVEVIRYFNQNDDTYRKWNTENGRLHVPKTICMIALDPQRREILYRIIPEALKRGAVMIYCGFHNVVEILEKHLSERFDGVYSVTGRTPIKKELDALENAKILLGTSKIFTGLSKERFMSIILYATIKKQTAQAIGRIKRWCDYDPSKNAVERVVYDIVDKGTLSELQFPFRRSVYQKEGWLLRS